MGVGGGQHDRHACEFSVSPGASDHARSTAAAICKGAAGPAPGAGGRDCRQPERNAARYRRCPALHPRAVGCGAGGGVGARARYRWRSASGRAERFRRHDCGNRNGCGSGTGADLVYPPLHHALAHNIATNGTIVSEWPNGRSARRPGQPISRSVTG